MNSGMFDLLYQDDCSGFIGSGPHNLETLFSLTTRMKMQETIFCAFHVCIDWRNNVQQLVLKKNVSREKK